jgi:YVTN family beta-propeller protein
VSDETGGRIIVVDLASGQIAANIAVGKRPRGLRLSRDGSQLFVALSGSPIGGPNVDESKLPPADRSADGIGVIDIAKGQLIRKLKAGPDPESFDLSPDGATLYASNEDAAEMSIVDVQSGEVRLRVKVGEEPEGVTVRPDGREVYVTCEGSNQVVAIDTATGKVVAHISVGARPRAVVFTSDGRTGFVTNENDGSISVVDTASHRTTATIKLPQTEAMPTVPRPMGAAIASDGPNIFFSLGRARAIAVVDASTRKPVRAIENVGDRPWGIAISSDGRTLYTANGPSGDISFVDVATGAITRRTATGGSPWGAVLGK